MHDVSATPASVLSGAVLPVAFRGLVWPGLAVRSRRSLRNALKSNPFHPSLNGTFASALAEASSSRTSYTCWRATANSTTCGPWPPRPVAGRYAICAPGEFLPVVHHLVPLPCPYSRAHTWSPTPHLQLEPSPTTLVPLPSASPTPSRPAPASRERGRCLQVGGLGRLQCADNATEAS